MIPHRIERAGLVARIVAPATFLVVMMLTACTRPADTPENETYRIVCTVGMVADAARHVAGEHAEVINIIGEGVDPHIYKPTAADLRTFRSADIIFYNGLLLEGRMTDTFAQLATRGQPVFAIAELIDAGRLLEADDAPGNRDPHVWMDVTVWSHCVDVIASTLAEFDPEHAAAYTANADAYKAQLQSLDSYVRQVIDSIPENRRVLVTAHDAFGYFGRAYGIEVLGIQGLSTDSEAGIDDINRLVDLIVEREVPAVFIESSVPDKSVRALIEGARSRGHTVRIGGELFSDAMGARGTYEGTYIGMIDHNATIVARALGGEAPAGGLSGRLAGHGQTP